LQGLLGGADKNIRYVLQTEFVKKNVYIVVSYPQQPSMPPMPSPAGIDPNRKRRLAIYGTLTGILICLAILLGLNAAGVLQLRANATSGNNLAAQGETQGPGLIAHGDLGPSGLSKEASPIVAMPDDIRDWLEHLRKCEERRKDLTQKNMTTALITLTEIRGAGDIEMVKSLLEEAGGSDPDPNRKTTVQRTVDESDQMRQDWIKLRDFFNSKAPPAECVPIRDNYDQVLRETGGMIGDINDIVNGMGDNAKDAITKLQALTGKSKKNIDIPAAQTDDGVKQICRKYNTNKWFDIKPDFGGSSLEKIGF
jgi:hypothetical protein